MGSHRNRSGVTGKTQSEGFSAAPASVKNQLTGFGYDQAGNMIANGTATYTYDAEDRLLAAGGMSYIYDGDGKRVKKCTQGSTAGTCAVSSVGTLYWSVPGSDTSTETDLAGNTLENYVFFNGKRVARKDVSGAVHFYFSDHLGTHSLITDLNGTMPPQSESDYYPYVVRFRSRVATPITISLLAKNGIRRRAWITLERDTIRPAWAVS